MVYWSVITLRLYKVKWSIPKSTMSSYSDISLLLKFGQDIQDLFEI